MRIQLSGRWEWGILGVGRVKSDGNRGQIRRLEPGKNGRLRVGSDGMGTGTRLGCQGVGPDRSRGQIGARGPVHGVPPI